MRGRGRDCGMKGFIVCTLRFPDCFLTLLLISNFNQPQLLQPGQAKGGKIKRLLQYFFSLFISNFYMKMKIKAELSK